MAITPQSMQKQRDDLYSQVKQASQQQAQANYQAGLGSLRQQLQQQRLNMNSARGQIAEQGAMNQRSIESQMASRGLGSSGLKDLAGLQSQLAQGQSINQLEQQNQLVQQEAMNTQRSLSNELTNNLRAADLTYADQMVQSTEKTYQQDLQDKQYMQSTVLELANMLDSGASEQSIKSWAQLMGLDIDSLDPATAEALANIGAGSAEQIEQITGVDVEGFANFAATTGNGISWGTAILGALAIAGGLAAAPFTGGVSLGLVGAGAAGVAAGTTGAIATSDVWKSTSGGKGINFQLGSEVINTQSRDEAERKITDHFASKYGEVKSGLVKVEVTPDAKVRFKFNGETYQTLGEARAATRNAPR